MCRLLLCASDEELVNRHLEKTYDGKGYTLWRCALCAYASRYKFNVSEHVRIRHLQLLQHVQCPHCAAQCTSKNSLRSHIWRLHKSDVAAAATAAATADPALPDPAQQ
jgi:hypothetical protein